MHNSRNDCRSAWSYPRRQTIHDACNGVGLSYGSCQHILADELSMRRITAKFVPRLLKNEQWDHQVQVCTELQKAVRHDPNFLSRAITGDVRPSAISMFSLKWNSRWKGDVSPPLKKSKQNRNGHANAGRLQWVLPKVAKSLGSLYTSPRWLLRRWRWKLGLNP